MKEKKRKEKKAENSFFLDGLLWISLSKREMLVNRKFQNFIFCLKKNKNKNMSTIHILIII